MERYFKNEIDLWLKQSTDCNKEIYHKHLLNMFNIFMKCDEGHSGMSIHYAANGLWNKLPLRARCSDFGGNVCQQGRDARVFANRGLQVDVNVRVAGAQCLHQEW